MKKFAFLFALAALSPAAASAQMLINGTGATFPAPIYQKWFTEYAKIDPSVRINYQPQGSGAGKKGIQAETVDFGASDFPLTDDEIAKAPRPLWNLPTVAGAVVITYNVPGNPALRLDGPTLADIFLGKVNKWNDSAITSQNPGVDLPAADIIVVHRSDSSGTSFIFTDYLTSVSDDWKSKVGKGAALQWPTGLGGKGNAGVAEQIKQSSGAIGYVEIAYAKPQHLPIAEMKNSSGNYITPSNESVVAALATATIPDDFRFSMVNAPGEKAYPIAGATWLLIYQQQKDHDKGEKLVQFLKWSYTDGQKMAGDLNYAALPDAVVARVLAKIGQITY
jgi:phosphate transport system substrate-binding protein